MIKRQSRQKIRRKFRVRKKQAVAISESANKQLERHVFRRWHNLTSGWRLTFTWILLIGVLITGLGLQAKSLGAYYLQPEPTYGGVYSEGLEGTFSNANPIFAAGDVDSSVSKLIFSPLLTYDKNNKLVGDLAESWKVDKRGVVYTVTLKDGVTWHDGAKFSADDVVFTYSVIKNPDAKSPLFANWVDVKVKKIDERTVTFTLPNPYSPFPHSLTHGIAPKHLLANINPSEMRSDSFNTKSPIGTGPFKVASISSESVNEDKQTTLRLVRYENYHRGASKLDGFTLKTYPNRDLLEKALQKKQVLAASGIKEGDSYFKDNLQLTSYSLMSANMIFMNNSKGVLRDREVRSALIKATDISEMYKAIDYTAVQVRTPILSSQVGYNPKYQQQRFNIEQAAKILDKKGWVINAQTGIREKNNKPLQLKLSLENTREFTLLADKLQQQWEKLGVKVDIIGGSQENAIELLDSHDYDLFLYGISIGADPDVYAYWHSSQISKKNPIHLNLSEYKSTTADLALEAGRSRLDPKLRAVKYQPFLAAWQKDAPAIGLYQPRYLTVSNIKVHADNPQFINTSADRYNDVQTWAINTVRSLKTSP
jgi:peptide/nickel transport system substrate-binding protein